jgi:UDP-N-acetylmuramoyl-tripeptide--D-alanyl-D-alanine ligase
MWPLTGNKISEIITKTSNVQNFCQNILIHGICTDSRKLQKEHMFIALQGEHFDGHAYLKECFEKGLKLALVNKNSLFLKNLSAQEKKNCLQVDNVLSAFRDLAKFMRKRLSCPVIAIGGSNGKTTTKEMLASLLSGTNYKITKTDKSENGYLGIALTLCQESHNINNQPHALVLEIGIDDIGAMQEHVTLSQPDVSLLTALGPEHLEHLKNWEIASEEELILFKNEKTKRIWQFFDEKILSAFYNFKDSKSKNLYKTEKDFAVIEKSQIKNKLIDKNFILENVSTIIVWEILSQKSFENKIKLMVFSNQKEDFLNKKFIFNIPLPGKHNGANFALAFATSLALQRTPQEIMCGWQNFSPPPMRSHVKILKDKNILYDDSYNSSPMSLDAALNTLQKNYSWKNKKKLIILGDMLELGHESKYWHEQVFHRLKKLQNAYLCLYGLAMYDCYKLLKETEEILVSHNNTKIYWLAPEKEPSCFLDFIDIKLFNFVILVKGSHGMNLFRIARTIEEKYC